MQETVSEFPLQKILRNFTLLSAAELISKAVLFVATAYLARTLGPAGFGMIGFAVAVVTYFRMIVDGGLGVHGIREVARNPSQSQKIVTSILGLRILLVVIAFAVVYGFTVVANRPALEEKIILLYALTFLPFALSLDWYFYGREKASWVAAGLLITQLAFASGIIVLIQRFEDVIRVPVIQTAAEGLAAIVLLAAYFKSEKLNFSALSKKFLQQTLSASAPIALSHAMRTINYTFDIVLIGFLMPPEPVGWYSASYRFVYFLIGFGMLYFQAFLAPISRSLQEGKESASLLLSQSLKTGAIAVLPAAAGTTLLAPQLLRLIFGTGYEGSIIPLQILIWSAALIILNGNFRQTLIASEEQRKLLPFTAESAALNIILNLLLIPRYGLAGAAWATVLSELLLLALCFRSVLKLGISISVGSSLLGPIFCTLLMSAVLYFTAPYGLVLAICFAVILYFAALIITRTVSVNVLERRAGS